MNSVVDASVAVKWYFAEEYSDAATRLLNAAQALSAPDLLVPEFTNVAWKYVRRGVITEREAQQALAALLTVPIELHPSTSIAPEALAIACRTGRTAYDSIYLALASSQGCRLVTADRRFFNAMQDTSYASMLVWVENVSEE